MNSRYGRFSGLSAARELRIFPQRLSKMQPAITKDPTLRARSREVRADFTANTKCHNSPTCDSNWSYAQPVHSPRGSQVRGRLAAGGKWIRTLGSQREGLGFEPSAVAS